jgi:hypothetical protein
MSPHRAQSSPIPSADGAASNADQLPHPVAQLLAAGVGDVVGRPLGAALPGGAGGLDESRTGGGSPLVPPMWRDAAATVLLAGCPFRGWLFVLCL